MNGIHAAILAHIREGLSKQGDASAATLVALPDDKLGRMVFASFRGRDAETRGMRLTNIGLQLMSEYFQSYVIPMASDHRVNNSELLYLDRRAKLPYFIDAAKVVVFETELGLKLKLADGDINILIEIEAT